VYLHYFASGSNSTTIFRQIKNETVEYRTPTSNSGTCVLQGTLEKIKTQI
jgi:hypothetical protein